MAVDRETAAAFDRGFQTEEGAGALFSSTVWEAWAVGRHLRETGCDGTCALIAARGSTYTVDSFVGAWRYQVVYRKGGAFHIESRETAS